MGHEGVSGPTGGGLCADTHLVDRLALVFWMLKNLGFLRSMQTWPFSPRPTLVPF